MIINADDFGLDHSTNQAILRCLQEGWCSSTTFMANSSGSEEAAELVRQHALQECVGLHLALDGMRAVTSAIREFPRFCDGDGNLTTNPNARWIHVGGRERAALAEEIRGQIRRARQMGVPLTHLDSHHHVHTAWGLGQIVMQVAQEERVPFIRLSRNMGYGNRWEMRAIKGLYNWDLRRRGLARTQYFGTIKDWLGMVGRMAKRSALPSVEMRVHPVLNAEGEVFDGDERMPMRESAQRIPNWREAASFAGTRYRAGSELSVN